MTSVMDACSVRQMLGPNLSLSKNVGQVSSHKNSLRFVFAQSIFEADGLGLPLLIRRVTKKLMASDGNKPSGDKPSGVNFHQPRKAEDMQVFSLEQIELVDIEVRSLSAKRIWESGSCHLRSKVLAINCHKLPRNLTGTDVYVKSAVRCPQFLC